MWNSARYTNCAGTWVVPKPTWPIWRLKTLTGLTTSLHTPAEKLELRHSFISVRRWKPSCARCRPRDFYCRRLPCGWRSTGPRNSNVAALVWAYMASRFIPTVTPGQNGPSNAVIHEVEDAVVRVACRGIGQFLFTASEPLEAIERGIFGGADKLIFERSFRVGGGEGKRLGHKFID